MDAALASALCDAQTDAATLERNEKGDKGAYTSSDVIALNARECLNKHGLSWMRTGVEIRAGKLMHSMEDPDNAEHTGSDIGMQCYAGDVLTKWILIHKEGGSIEGTSAMAVITSRGRPHDKAVAASLTYLTGQTLLRILCWDRETKEAVDKRKELEARSSRGGGKGQPRPQGPPTRRPRPTDLGARCSGPKGGHISEANERHMKALAVRDGCDMGEVWADGLRGAGVDLAKYGAQWPNNAQSLTIADGMKLRDELKSRVDERQAGDDPDTDPTNGDEITEPDPGAP